MGKGKCVDMGDMNWEGGTGGYKLWSLQREQIALSILLVDIS